ncbi:hypothetical protein [Miniphocaeibacter massiliensis]|uniref:hypothetical protein n=1 Tax=Miniphocaeibacter massiliensis TaxID=2041841 RepID=UPI000C1BDC8A|nr:hypothetical protein [Miniphocaeibacter massiliensis]
MIEKLEAITHSLKQKCYIPALALALTIPDICGNIEYPNLITSKGYRKVKKQYTKWFDEYVSLYYTDYTEFDKDKKIPKNPYFTGRMCYDLRCSFLHSGTSKIDAQNFKNLNDKKSIYEYKFKLCVNGADSYGTSFFNHDLVNGKQKKEYHITINVEDLCYYIVNSAKIYYNKTDKNKFIDYNINIVDIQSKYNYIKYLNKKTPT